MATKRHQALLLTSLLLLLALPLLPQTPTLAQETSHTFPETGKTVRGIFLQYWTTHGSLAQQGYPISDEMMLKSTDGKEYLTQFFQRAVFEQHVEFAGTPNEVLLKLVGQTFYQRHFQSSPPPNQAVNPTNTMTFKETGHSIGGKFREYWEKHGGLAQQGYPMTDEFRMASTDGKEYTTQVFQRAVFELHPEFAGTENEVLLRLLGVEEWEALNNPASGATPATTTPTPVVQQPTETPEPTATPQTSKVEKVAGKEWFGGFKPEWKLDDGRIIGWSNPEKGRADLEKNLMLMLVAQGRYGGSVEDVESHIKDNPIVDVDLPVYDSSVPGNYPERSPSLITFKTFQWNTNLETILTQGALPFEYRIRIYDSRIYYALAVIDGKLTYLVSGNFALTEQYLSSYSLVLNTMLEAAARVREADKYSKHVTGKDDFLNQLRVKFGTGYDPNYPYATQPNDFLQVSPKYIMLGTNH